MASSLGYAMMNWTSEFARHAKAKRNKKKNSKNKENCDDRIINNITSIHSKDSKQKISKIADSTDFECNEVEIQTDGKFYHIILRISCESDLLTDRKYTTVFLIVHNRFGL